VYTNVFLSTKKDFIVLKFAVNNLLGIQLLSNIIITRINKPKKDSKMIISNPIAK
jgi:hypothetical protein